MGFPDTAEDRQIAARFGHHLDAVGTAGGKVTVSAIRERSAPPSAAPGLDPWSRAPVKLAAIEAAWAAYERDARPGALTDAALLRLLSALRQILGPQ